MCFFVVVVFRGNRLLFHPFSKAYFNLKVSFIHKKYIKKSTWKSIVLKFSVILIITNPVCRWIRSANTAENANFKTFLK